VETGHKERKKMTLLKDQTGSLNQERVELGENFHLVLFFQGINDVLSSPVSENSSSLLMLLG
jgi:hypothetical protein